MLFDLAERKIRVLHISGRSDHGGGPEHIFQLISASSPDFEHHVACPRSGIYWQRFADLLGEDRLCAIPHRWFGPTAFLTLQRFVKRRGIGIIHSHGSCGGLYGRLSGAASGTPVVHTFHGVPVTPSLKHFAYRWVEPILALATTRAIAVSDGEAEIVRSRWSCYRDRVSVIVNGIDRSAVAPLPAAPSRRQDQPLRLVSFSRRNHQKNPELLLDVAHWLARFSVPFRLDCYGQGIADSALGLEARRRGIADRIGLHPPQDVPSSMLANADIYLSTSRWEGMPLSILEAWRAGLVVVASDVVGNNDLVRDRFNGRLFRSEDGHGAANAIRDLFLDPDSATQLRVNARQVLHEKHCSRVMMNGLAGIYQECARGEVEPSPITAAIARSQVRPSKTAKARGDSQTEDEAELATA